jgi:hypothetical protein
MTDTLKLKIKLLTSGNLIEIKENTLVNGREVITAKVEITSFNELTLENIQSELDYFHFGIYTENDKMVLYLTLNSDKC